jgi:hypothetical protein
VRNWKVINVSQELLAEFLTTGVKRAVEVKGGLPPGAEFDGAVYNPIFGQFALRFRHDSFPEVMEGCEAPQLTPTASVAPMSEVEKAAFDRGVMAAHALPDWPEVAPVVVKGKA